MTAPKLSEVIEIRNGEIVGRPWPVRIVRVPAPWIVTAIILAFVVGVLVAPIFMSIGVGE
jgi:hypothetical protein